MERRGIRREKERHQERNQERRGAENAERTASERKEVDIFRQTDMSFKCSLHTTANRHL